MKSYPIISISNCSPGDFITFWSRVHGSPKPPVFDQHAFRSFWYLTTGNVQEIKDVLTEAIPVTHLERAKKSLYNSKYLPFAHQFTHKNISLRKVDQAMYGFGKFLKSEISKALLLEPEI